MARLPPERTKSGAGYEAPPAALLDPLPPLHGGRDAYGDGGAAFPAALRWWSEANASWAAELLPPPPGPERLPEPMPEPEPAVVIPELAAAAEMSAGERALALRRARKAAAAEGGGLPAVPHDATAAAAVDAAADAPADEAAVAAAAAARKKHSAMSSAMAAARAEGISKSLAKDKALAEVGLLQPAPSAEPPSPGDLRAPPLPPSINEVRGPHTVEGPASAGANATIGDGAGNRLGIISAGGTSGERPAADGTVTDRPGRNRDRKTALASSASSSASSNEESCSDSSSDTVSGGDGARSAASAASDASGVSHDAETRSSGNAASRDAPGRALPSNDQRAGKGRLPARTASDGFSDSDGDADGSEGDADADAGGGSTGAGVRNVAFARHRHHTLRAEAHAAKLAGDAALQRAVVLAMGDERAAAAGSRRRAGANCRAYEDGAYDADAADGRVGSGASSRGGAIVQPIDRLLRVTDDDRARSLLPWAGPRDEADNGAPFIAGGDRAPGRSVPGDDLALHEVSLSMPVSSAAASCAAAHASQAAAADQRAAALQRAASVVHSVQARTLQVRAAAAAPPSSDAGDGATAGDPSAGAAGYGGGDPSAGGAGCGGGDPSAGAAGYAGGHATDEYRRSVGWLGEWAVVQALQQRIASHPEEYPGSRVQCLNEAGEQHLLCDIRLLRPRKRASAAADSSADAPAAAEAGMEVARLVEVKPTTDASHTHASPVSPPEVALAAAQPRLYDLWVVYGMRPGRPESRLWSAGSAR
jgi:hypothetical protein